MMTMRIATRVLAALAIVACGDEEESPLISRAYMVMAKDSSGGGTTPAAADPKVIRSGELRVEVRNAELAAARADSAVMQRGGLVAERGQTAGANGRRTAHLVVRVPADRFKDAVENLKSLGDVKGETISQQDVTKAYFDLEVHLAVKEQALGRLRQLLATKAARLADVLDVEREITRVVSEIEQLKGDRRYYDNRIALSTIELTLVEPGASASGPSLTIRQALAQSFDVFSTSVAWLVYIATFLAPWLGFTTLAWWTARRIRRRVA
jgi:hypothetical protein